MIIPVIGRVFLEKVFVLLCAMFFLMACVDDELNTDKQEYEIKPSASVADIVTRVAPAYNGPINSTFTTSFPIGIYAYDSSLGWKAGTSSSSTPHVPNLINNDNATVSSAAGHAIIFNTGAYYFPSGGENVIFHAYTPYGTETTPATNGGAPSVTISLNGQQDVMYATTTGHKTGSAPVVQPSFSLTHKLTQLQFSFVAGSGYPTSGNSVSSLTVNNQPSSLVMNIGTGAISTSGSISMQALSTANQTAGIPITATVTNANSPVMTTVSGGTSAYLLSIIVKVGSSGTATYTNVPINLTSVAGSAHMITITFTQSALSLTVTAGTWATVTGGTINNL